MMLKVGTSKKNEKNTFQIITSNGLHRNISAVIDWESSNVMTMQGGVDLVTVPIELKRNNIAINGSYLLLIEKRENNFSSKFIFSEVNDEFNNIAGNKTKISRLYNDLFKNVEHITSKNLTSMGINGGDDGGGPSEHDERYCIDWYLVTTIYDFEGNVVGKFESFMYQTCSEPGRGGSYSNGNEVADSTGVFLDFGTPVSIAESTNIIFENDTARSKNATWVFCEATGFKFKSREVLTQVKFLGTSWHFANLMHDLHYVTGGVLFTAISIDSFNWAQTNTLTSVRTDVEWRTKFEVSTPIGGGTFYGDFDQASHTWNSW